MERIETFLQGRRETGLLRTLRPARYRREGLIYLKGKNLFDFSSNDYLGLSNHPKIKNASQEAIRELGTSSSGSRLLSGDLDIHHLLEERTARFKGKEAALVFNSGYQANLGIISSVCKRGDVIFCDRLSHASILDGIILSRAQLFRFGHNDLDSLEYLLRRERHRFRNSFIITETVFSMDGDIAPLKEIVDLKDRYGSIIMVDEAHATGIFGETGAGIAEEMGLTDQIDLIMGTFSKALGSFGAYVACSNKMKEYLINTSRGFIYSTALPPAVIAANIASLEIIRDEPFRRKALLENAAYFRGQLRGHGFETRGSSQIVPFIVGDARETVHLSDRLRERDYWVSPIRPPTVGAGESRLRLSLTYHHTKNLLERLVMDICDIYRV
ncbi:MAG: 8-amino-7-oxononanoate synthase [Nitrospiraceae bacterium]|nr:8-amino-7-oxononanoate synthase [Nitrospiraceae bacterium]